MSRVVRRGVVVVASLVALAGRSTVGKAQVTTLTPLAFGTIVTGTTTSIAPSSVDAASWRVHGSIGIAGVISIGLPSSLVRAGGGSMPISFCSTCGLYRTNNSNPAGGTTFNPNLGLVLTITVLSDLYVWVGGSVSPPLAQAPGSYSGTIILTATPLL